MQPHFRQDPFYHIEDLDLNQRRTIVIRRDKELPDDWGKLQVCRKFLFCQPPVAQLVEGLRSCMDKVDEDMPAWTIAYKSYKEKYL